MRATDGAKRRRIGASGQAAPSNGPLTIPTESDTLCFQALANAPTGNHISSEASPLVASHICYNTTHPPRQTYGGVRPEPNRETAEQGDRQRRIPNSDSRHICRDCAATNPCGAYAHAGPGRTATRALSKRQPTANTTDATKAHTIYGRLPRRNMELASVLCTRPVPAAKKAYICGEIACGP